MTCSFGLTPLPQTLGLVIYRDEDDDTYSDADALAEVGLSPLVWRCGGGELTGDGEEVISLALEEGATLWVVDAGDATPFENPPLYNPDYYGVDILVTPARSEDDAVAIATAWDAHPTDKIESRELQRRIVDWLSRHGFEDPLRALKEHLAEGVES